MLPATVAVSSRHTDIRPMFTTQDGAKKSNIRHVLIFDIRDIISGDVKFKELQVHIEKDIKEGAVARLVSLCSHIRNDIDPFSNRFSQELKKAQDELAGKKGNFDLGRDLVKHQRHGIMISIFLAIVIYQEMASGSSDIIAFLLSLLFFLIYNLSTFKLGPWLVKRYQKYAELLHANYQAKGRPYEDTRRFTLYLSDPIEDVNVDCAEKIHKAMRKLERESLNEEAWLTLSKMFYLGIGVPPNRKLGLGIAYNLFLAKQSRGAAVIIMRHYENCLSDDNHIHDNFAIVEQEGPSDEMSKVWRHYGIKVNSDLAYKEGIAGRHAVSKWRVRASKCESLVNKKYMEHLNNSAAETARRLIYCNN